MRCHGINNRARCKCASCRVAVKCAAYFVPQTNRARRITTRGIAVYQRGALIDFAGVQRHRGLAACAAAVAVSEQHQRIWTRSGCLCRVRHTLPIDSQHVFVHVNGQPLIGCNTECQCAAGAEVVRPERIGAGLHDKICRTGCCTVCVSTAKGASRCRISRQLHIHDHPCVIAGAIAGVDVLCSGTFNIL